MTNLLKIQNHLAGNPQKQPQFAKTIQFNQKTIVFADPQATRALVALMDMYAVLGGAASHYGGPAAMAELMSALHAIMFDYSNTKNKNWYECFNFVNDAGHCENGLYALKANYQMAGLTIDSLKKFRSIESGLTGHGEVHCFPEGVLLSNGPLGSAFPQSQGLAMADSLAQKNRVTVSVISDGACMEGEAKEALAAIPGLAQKKLVAPYVLIISDNNTKLSGRIDKDSFSMENTFQSMKQLGWEVIDLAEGNDLEKCYQTIELAIEKALANPEKPVAIHARTIKGIGNKKAAESASGGHGFPLKSPTELSAFLTEIYHGQKYPEVFDSWIAELIDWEKRIKESGFKDTGEKIQVGVANAMIQAKKRGLPVVSITSDLPGSTGVAGFRKEFPTDSFDVGIAESNMISAAIGFSKCGFIPVVDTFAQFGVTKGALPLTMASLSEAPIIGIFSHTGFQDAADGASHQALSYISMLASIPYVDLYCLSCSEEAEKLITQTINDFALQRENGKVPHSSIFFLGRENFPKNFVAGYEYQLKNAQIVSEKIMNDQKNVTLLTSGSLLQQALNAQETLLKQNIGSIVVQHACVNHIDVLGLQVILEKTHGNLITIEDHQLIGGFGSIVSHALKLANTQFQIRSLGVQGQFGQSAYTANELYKKHLLDSTAIHSTAMQLLNGR